ncbi:long-chain fatty acid--CoA ligase [Hylemonella gracilis]|uniref:Long-chain fatty acid--CoA ligase n=1 Tax=Hylemonella gracilis TaxID=80880 RepID=A0A4V1A296_9BURK|nr:long-chain fatty acid--CoA ligase [Hylemonella gracilis]QBK05279.1 long-chain fatty acid--CoA ligase [Hylemonella gracilis]
MTQHFTPASTATPIDPIQTLPELLAWRAAQSPEREAYREFDASTQQWRSLTWGQTLPEVQRWQRALTASGIQSGQRVAILLPNGFHAMRVDQATLAQGAVPVPLHAIDNPGSIAYILSDSAAGLLMLSQVAQWQQIQAAAMQAGIALDTLRTVVCTEATAQELGATGTTSPQPRLLALNDWLNAGRSAGQNGDVAVATPPGPEDLATIVYTSGTTGKPKGVMLTHRNVLANVKAIYPCVTPLPDDVFLSFLPLSHTFERTTGYYLPIAAGSAVVYARSVQQLAEDMKLVRPTVLISVPRIYERVHARLQEVLSKSGFKQRLFEAAQAKGWRRFRAAQGLKGSTAEDQIQAAKAGWLRVLPWVLLRKLVAQPLLAQFGGRIRIAVSGGAPLAQTQARCFLGLGLPLLQGYGMTETSPVVAANRPDDNDPATVGRALPGVQVRIGDNRELQVRGPSVMRGYWNRPEDTARVLDAEGWLSTGDQAEIDGQGRIRILGRIKEIIVTSTGEKVPPGDLEQAILADPLFEQVFVVGEQRPFIAAVVVVQAEEWTKLAKGLGLVPQAEQSLAAPEVLAAVLKRIERATGSFAHYAVPRAVTLTRELWTIENGLMTPTLKLKRNNLMVRFESAIEAMYRKR